MRLIIALALLGGAQAQINKLKYTQVAPGACRGNGGHDSVKDLVKEPPVVELYPEALVWSRINWKPTVGILVAQNARTLTETREFIESHRSSEL